MKPKFNNKFLYFVGIFLMLPIIMFFGIEVGIILLSIFLLISVFYHKKIKINSTFLSLFILSIITVIILLSSSLDFEWKKAGIKHFILFSIITLFSCISDYIFSEEKICSFIKGIKIGCMIQVVWSIIQFFAFQLFSFDINNFVFNRVLHFTDRAARLSIDNNIIRVSGMGWHPGLLVPIIIVSYLLIDKLLIKFLLLFIAIITRSSTCIFAVLLCMLLELLYKFLKKGIKKFSKKNLLLFFTIPIFISILYLVYPNIFEKFFSSFSNLISRIFMVYSNNVTDLSTSYHLRYYTFLPELIKKGSLNNLLFGYGYECSGYPYTLYLNQFSSYGQWSTETDLINFLVGRGLIWTITYYSWLISNFIKGSKISYKYTIYYICIMLCGILYNNQFPWMITIEIVFAICIAKNINVFSFTENKRKEKGEKNE